MRVTRLTDVGAQEYYDGLIAQGYTPEQATGFTQQHFPGFLTSSTTGCSGYQVDQSKCRL